MQSICDVLVKQDSHYNDLLDFFANEADKETCILGVTSQATVTKKQLAAQILNDIECLGKPIAVNLGSPPEDF